MLRLFLEPALSVPLKTTLHGLSFKMQAMCGMSVEEETSSCFFGRQGERGRLILIR